MANVLKAIVLVFVATAGSGVNTRKLQIPGSSSETASELWRVPSDVGVRDTSVPSNSGVSVQTMANDSESTRRLEESHEESSIQPVEKPFIQVPGVLGVFKQRYGISLLALGEPKSATTWLGRIVPALAINLCGSYNNPWCQLGGLRVYPNVPAPFYEFELLNKTTDGTNDKDLFLHFYGQHKHKIPGMHQPELPVDCRNGGRVHKDSFMDLPPCEREEPPTRQGLTSCLWETSPRCVRRMSISHHPVRNDERPVEVFPSEAQICAAAEARAPTPKPSKQDGNPDWPCPAKNCEGHLKLVEKRQTWGSLCTVRQVCLRRPHHLSDVVHYSAPYEDQLKAVPALSLSCGRNSIIRCRFRRRRKGRSREQRKCGTISTPSSPCVPARRPPTGRSSSTRQRRPPALSGSQIGYFLDGHDSHTRIHLLRPGPGSAS